MHYLKLYKAGMTLTLRN